jgi:hypothetical protein
MSRPQNPRKKILGDLMRGRPEPAGANRSNHRNGAYSLINWREIMPDKSPHEHHIKKPATRTLKEKRVEKHAKEHEHDMSAASDAVQEAHEADHAHKPDAWHQGDAAHKKQ